MGPTQVSSKQPRARLSRHPWQGIVDNFFHHLIAWQHLASQCEQKGLLLFKLRPKHHGLDHMVSQLFRTKINPRKSMSCFADESFLGHLKKIVTKCHSVSVLRRFYQRYLILLSFRWHESKSWISALLGFFWGQGSGPPNCGHVDPTIHAAWQHGQKGASVWLLAIQVRNLGLIIYSFWELILIYYILGWWG